MESKITCGLYPDELKNIDLLIDSLPVRALLIDEEFCIQHPYIEPGKYELLSVSDTAHGMPKEILEHIFDPFFTTKEKGNKGTGLGLSIVYGIVKAHAGYIDCRSEPVVGTTFNVYFPIIEGEYHSMHIDFFRR